MTQQMRQLMWYCGECGNAVPIPGPGGYRSRDAYWAELQRIAALHGVQRFENHPILIERMGADRLTAIRQQLASGPCPAARPIPPPPPTSEETQP